MDSTFHSFNVNIYSKKKEKIAEGITASLLIARFMITINYIVEVRCALGRQTFTAGAFDW